MAPSNDLEPLDVTFCDKIPRKICAPDNCRVEEGPEDCQETSDQSTIEQPIELCDLQPQKHCSQEKVKRTISVISKKNLQISSPSLKLLDICASTDSGTKVPRGGERDLQHADGKPSRNEETCVYQVLHQTGELGCRHVDQVKLPAAAASIVTTFKAVVWGTVRRPATAPTGRHHFRTSRVGPDIG